MLKGIKIVGLLLTKMCILAGNYNELYLYVRFFELCKNV